MPSWVRHALQEFPAFAVVAAIFGIAIPGLAIDVRTDGDCDLAPTIPSSPRFGWETAGPIALHPS